MTIAEYNAYYRQNLQRIVENYVEKKYGKDESILCSFNPFYVETNEKDGVANHGHLLYIEPEVVMLTKEDYCSLLFAAVQHPGLVFQELPFYIPIKLYRHIVNSFSYVSVLDSDNHPDVMNGESMPIAVHMTTLLADAREIIGNDRCFDNMQRCSPYRNYEQASVDVKICMGIMEVYVDCENSGNMSLDINATRHRDIYGMIDAQKVMSVLNVKTCKDIPNALHQLFAESTVADQNELTWLIRWLDIHGIAYIHAEGDQERVYTEYRYKSKWIESSIR